MEGKMTEEEARAQGLVEANDEATGVTEELTARIEELRTRVVGIETQEAEDNALDLDGLIELARVCYWAEPDEYVEDLDEFDDHRIVELWNERKSIMGLISAAKRVKEAIEIAMSKKLGPAGVMRLDDFKVSVLPKRKLRVIDPEGFVEWVGDDWPSVVNISGANIRTKALKAIAERRGLDPDHALDTFCEVEVEDEGRLTTVPLDKAGQKWSKLDHGEGQGVVGE